MASPNADYKFNHEPTTHDDDSNQQVIILPTQNQEFINQSVATSCGIVNSSAVNSRNDINNHHRVIVSTCQGCSTKEREIEELKAKLKIVTEDRNNQIKLNNNLLNENIELEKKLRVQIPETYHSTWNNSTTIAKHSPSNHLTITLPSSSPSMAHLPPSATCTSENHSDVLCAPNDAKQRMMNYSYQQDDDRLVELLPKTNVYCSAVTRETGKGQPDAGHAVCYLFKRFFTMDELAESSLGAHSKNGFKQLPTKIVQAIKAFVICNFTQKDGQKIGVTLLNHTINSLCGQARILKKRGKKWKVKAEKEEFNDI